MIIVTYFPPEHGPSDAGEGKFVQLCWRGQEYLVFAPRALYPYHVDILSRFLDEQGIPYKRLGEQYLLIKDSLLNVSGGGRFQVDPAKRTLALWDNSSAYGRFEEAGLAERIAGAFHPWKDFQVSIS